MADVLRVVLSLGVSGGVLFLAVLGISRMANGRFGRAWQYYLWLLVLLRLLAPFALADSPVNRLFRLAPAVQQAEVQAVQAVQDAGRVSADGAGAGDGTAAAGGGLTLKGVVDFALRWLWVPWLAVALGLLVRKATQYQGFATYIRAGNTAVDDPAVLDRLAGVCEEMGIKRQVGLYVNPLAASPLMLGFFRPCIILQTAELEADAFRLVVMHELTHLKRCDLLYKWLAQVALCVHWYNPLVHWLVKRVNADCELACDESVMARLDFAEQRAYGHVLIASMQSEGQYRQAVAGLTLSEDAKTVKERLGAMMMRVKRTKWMAAVSVLVAGAVLAGGVLLGAAVPGLGSAQAGIDLEGKSDAYKLIAKLYEVDTAQSVDAYTQAVLELCKEGGMSLFEAMADADIYRTQDPLYGFVTGTLAHTSSEVFAEAVGNPAEVPYMDGYAQWEAYMTQAEREAAERGTLSDEEWAAYLEATKDDEVYPNAFWMAGYIVTYEVLDEKALTVDAREEVFAGIERDVQAYVDGLAQDVVMDTGFEKVFAAKVAEVVKGYEGSLMKLEAEVSFMEGYENGEPIFGGY